MKEITQYILRWADDALIMSHRLASYCSYGPFLEEDLAISNVALDYLGQAEALYEYAAKVDDKWKSADDWAYLRRENEYFNCHLVEQPNADFARLMVKQFLYDCYNYETYSDLVNSKDEVLSALAQKSIKEVRYHLKRSTEWMIRLGLGTELSNQKMQDALDNLWKFTGELFEVDGLDVQMQKEGIGIKLADAKGAWTDRVENVLKQAQLKLPEDGYMSKGGRRGIHTEYMGYLLAEMQYLRRSYPDAVW